MACVVPRRTILRKLGVSTLRNLAGSIPKNLTDSIWKNLTRTVLKKTLVMCSCLAALAWVHPAVAQVHSPGHVGGGGHVAGGVRVGVPALPAHVPISQPRFVVGPHRAGVGPVFRFVPRPGLGFRHRFFFGTHFFRFPANSPYLSLWWPSCGPGLGWGWGVECYPQPFYGYGFGNYAVTLPTYESPVYWYGGEERDLVWLYLKDGTVYPVTDYWFVNGQVHFTLVEDDPRKPAKHVVPSEQLDAEKMVYVNSRRGFRVVVRDEPWPQYLKDHPEATPPELAPPEKN